MKLVQSTKFWIMSTFICIIGYAVSCTKNDQVIIPDSGSNSTTLVSVKTAVAPTIDGTIDAIWANATKISFMPTVPDPGNGLFTGYNGEQYPATLRSMYDANNIYFLLEVTDATKSVNVSPWYFNPALNVAGVTTGWQKEPSSKTLDINGNLTRDGFGEDKFAMLWNIDNSTPKFITQTCYASCHVFTPYLDYTPNPKTQPMAASPVMNSNSNNGNHYTNGQFEKIDMWWGKLGFITSDPSMNIMDDNYQDYAGGPTVTNLTGGSANGRHIDGVVVDTAKTYYWPYAPHYTSYSSTIVATPPAGQMPAMGEVSNSQNLKLDGTGASVAVPIWVKPNVAANFILPADTLSSGKAKRVTAVASTGVLTLSDGTTLDPTVGTAYQRTGDPVYGPTAVNSISAYINVPITGGRADIICAATYTGTGWIIEYKRALKTSDALKQDVDFSSLQDQPFGVAFWNKSNNQHGINPNLLLTFKK